MSGRLSVTHDGLQMCGRGMLGLRLVWSLRSSRIRLTGSQRSSALSLYKNFTIAAPPTVYRRTVALRVCFGPCPGRKVPDLR